MGNRSLPRTLFHLFTRPGYMIGEYLDGKRMPFFPPVKMLFVLCIFFALATTLVDGYSIEDTLKKEVAKEMKEKIKEQATVVADSTARNDSTAKADSSKIVLSGQPAEAKREVENKATEKKEEDNDNPSKEMLFTVNGNKIKVEDFIDGVKGIAKWLEDHKAIELLCLHCFFMFFSWRVFRKSPIRPETTLAENFFSQVYISGQMMAASIVYVLIFGNTKSTFYPLPWWALFGLFVWDFKQLFGYEWKATVKRTILIHAYSFIAFIFICVIVILILGIITGICQSIIN